MKKITVMEQLCILTHQDYTLDNESTNGTQASLEEENQSPIPRSLRTHTSQKYELPQEVGEIEIRINNWLDQQGILMANPSEKEELYYEFKRNNIWANFRNSVSSNNLSSMSQIGSQPFDEQIFSPNIRSPELRQLPKLNSISDLHSEQDLQLNSRKQSDSLFERRKGRMKTMQVQGSPIAKPSIYSQSKCQVQDS